MSKYDLSGYATRGLPTITNYFGKKYAIQKYQGEHEREYSVMELQDDIPNGPAQLFKSGILQMSWMMKDGERDGKVTTYVDGVVDRVMRWSDLERGDNCFCLIVNDICGKRLMEERVENGEIVIYRGGFNENWERDGFGIEYDQKSGVEIRSGYYRNGILNHIHQEFEAVTVSGKNKLSASTMRMTEYGGDFKEDNVADILKLRVKYIGGYRFDEITGEFHRHGLGKVINEITGVCERIGEWDNGEEVDGNNFTLFSGWFSDGESDQSIREVAAGSDKIVLCEELQLSIIRRVENFSLPSNIMNNNVCNSSTMELKFSQFPLLQKIQIGSNCFKYVRNVLIECNSQLRSIIIGNNCFSLGENERKDGVFQVTNCPLLQELVLNNNSCCDFMVFELDNTPSLSTLHIGDYCFKWAIQFTLKGMIEYKLFSSRSSRTSNGLLWLLYFCLRSKCYFSG